jgi:hypothetical protein
VGKFKKDFGLETKDLVEEQSDHGTPIARAVYAWGLEEALGHIESKRAEYRAVSEEWHALLGVGSQKRKAVGSTEAPLAKRIYTEAEVQERIQAVLKE